MSAQAIIQHPLREKEKTLRKEQQELEETVDESPEEVGVDAPGGRRRSSSSTSTRPMMSGTQSRAAGG